MLRAKQPLYAVFLYQGVVEPLILSTVSTFEERHVGAVLATTPDYTEPLSTKTLKIRRYRVLCWWRHSAETKVKSYQPPHFVALYRVVVGDVHFRACQWRNCDSQSVVVILRANLCLTFVHPGIAELFLNVQRDWPWFRDMFYIEYVLREVYRYLYKVQYRSADANSNASACNIMLREWSLFG